MRINASIALRVGLAVTIFLFSLNTYSQKYIRVKFKQEVADALNMQGNVVKQFTDKGYVKTNFNNLDRITSKYRGIEMKRIFRYAGKFEERHRNYGLHLWYEIKLDAANNSDFQSCIDELKGIEEVYFAEQVYEKTLFGILDEGPKPTFAPNDPMYDQQWHYNNTGQTGGLAGADISLEEAWDIQSGSNTTIVAITDGGIDFTHPDLADAMWINSAEANGVAGVDDDLNGYIDDIYGYSFADNTGNILPDPDGHGTHVAGTIGATNNNGIGVAGIAGGSGIGDGIRLMSCAVFGSSGGGSGFEEAYVYAADMGAVINQNSWGYTSSGYYEQTVLDAIDYFIDNAGRDSLGAQVGPLDGGLVIFAAGNNNSSSAHYPAYYDSVIAVASTNHMDQKSWYSNYGTWVDIAAPGGETSTTNQGVLSTLPGPSYGFYQGTSMACPHVSGVAALLVSEYGGMGTTPQMIRDLLINSTDSINSYNPGYEGLLGSGRLNAYKAIMKPDTIPPGVISDLTVVDSSEITVTLNWTATGANDYVGKAKNYEIRYASSEITADNFNDAILYRHALVPSDAGNLESAILNGLNSSTNYYFAIKAHDAYGNVSDISNTVSSTTLDAPAISLSPTTISGAIDNYMSFTETITISNTGLVDLHVNIDDSVKASDNFIHSFTQVSDTLAPNESVNIDFTIIDNGLQPDNYIEFITINSNDPLHPVDTITANVHINGVPGLTYYPNDLSYGELFITDTISQELFLQNTGTDTLIIDSMLSNNSVFIVQDFEPSRLYNSDSVLVKVAFAPLANIQYWDSIAVYSNSSVNPVQYIGVNGTGLLPPVISVSPDSFDVHLFTGDSLIRHLTIDNTAGGNDLVYNISFSEDTVLPLSASKKQKLENLGIRFDNINGNRLEYSFSDEIKVDNSIKHIEGSRATNLSNDLSGMNVALCANRSVFSTELELLGANTYYYSYFVPSILDSTDVLVIEDRNINISYAGIINDWIKQGGNLIIDADQDNVVYDSICSGSGISYVPIYSNAGYASYISSHPITNNFAQYYIEPSSMCSWKVSGNAEVLISDTNGYTFAAAAKFGRGKIVTIGNESLINYSENNIELGVNAVRWFKSGSGWLSVDSLTGIVPAGNTIDLNVSFNAMGLYGGQYIQTININSNDPVNEDIFLQATLNVTGIPIIGSELSTIDFDTAFVGYSQDRSVTIVNDGTDSLFIDSLKTSNSAFIVQGTVPGLLLPTDTAQINIRFAPIIEGALAEELTIYNNSAENIYTIPLNGTAILPPLISVTPDSFDVHLFTGDSLTRYLTIDNTAGGSDLTYTIGLINQTMEHTSESFKLNKILTEKDQYNPLTATRPKDTYSYRVQSDILPKLHSTSYDLEVILDSLNTNYSSIISQIPNYYTFSNGETGNNISDGGNDMYDGGNYINTNLASSIYYSNNSVLNSSGFGAKGRYFTLKVPGLFMLGADIDQLSTFGITGNLGADGSGYVESSEIALSVNGQSYLGFIKRVYSSYDPSVNHLIIIPNSRDSITHTISTSTNNDFDEISGINNTDRLYYLLFAGASSDYYSNEVFANVMTSFLEIVGASGWLNIEDNTSGSIHAGQSLDVPIGFNAESLWGGNYDQNIRIESNDSANKVVDVPVHMEVTGIPIISSDLSTIDFDTAFVGYSQDRSVSIVNDGTDSLFIDSLKTSNSAFTVQGTVPGLLLPTDTAQINIRFAPIIEGALAEELTIYNNSAENIYTILLNGTAILPPVISVTPDSFDVHLFTGDSLVRHLTIDNTAGGSELTYDITFLDTSQVSILEMNIPSELINGLNNSNELVNSSINEEYYAIGDIDTLPNSPSPLTCLAVNPVTGIIYGQQNEGTLFYSFNPSTNIWSVLASCPINSSNNGGATYLNGKIYTCYTSSSTIGEYDIATNSWITLSNGVNTGNITTDGTYLYLASGSSLFRYDVTSQSLSTISSSSPISFDKWGGLEYVDKKIYGHSGNGSTYLAVYDFNTSSWTQLANSPSGAILGSAYDIRTDKYYAYGSYSGRNLYEYDVATDIWTTTYLKVFSVNDGGLVYNPHSSSRSIYFIEGETGTGFAKLDVGGGSDFLSMPVMSGTVPAGANVDLDVKFDASGLYGGNYYQNITIESNDSANKIVNVPVHMEVTGIPIISSDLSTIDFDTAFVGYSQDRSVTIVNDGTDSLFIDSLKTSNSAFTVQGTVPGLLLPTDTAQINIRFAPIIEGAFAEELTIYNNSAENIYTIPLNGTAILPPLISVTPDSFEVHLFTGDSLTRYLTIDNSAGGSDLKYNISITPADTMLTLSESKKQKLEALGIQFEKIEDGIVYYSFAEDVKVDNETIHLEGSRTSSLSNDLSGLNIALCVSRSTFMAELELLGASTYYYSYFIPTILDSTDVLVIEDGYISTSYTRAINDWIKQGGNLIIDSDGDHYIYDSICSGSGISYLSTSCSSGYASYISSHQVTSDFAQYYVASGSTCSWQVSGNAEVLLSDYYGRTFAAVGKLGRGKIVTIANESLNSSSENNIELGINAVKWFKAGAGWLSIDSLSGIVPAGNSVDLEVLFDANGLYGGFYDKNIRIESNDSANKVVDVPVHLNVEAYANISTDTLVAFSDVYVNSTESYKLEITNVGMDSLVINNISCTNTDITVSNTVISVQPGESDVVMVYFNPSSVYSETDTLIISYNSYDGMPHKVPVNISSIEPPVIDVNPSELSFVIPIGSEHSESLTISNTGNSVLSYQIKVAGITDDSLEYVMDAMNTNYDSITSLIPERYDFTEGSSGYRIFDGGNNMCDYGNYLNTSSGSINYSDKTIQSSYSLGISGRYFTAKYPGLFMFAGDMDSIGLFQISGSLGSYSGYVDTTDIVMSIGGKEYHGYVKRTYGDVTPSVNHLIIVENPDEYVYSECNYNSYSDYQTIRGLDNSRRIYYLLWAGNNGYYYADSIVSNIMAEFLYTVTSNDWIELSNYSGSIMPGNETDISATVNTDKLEFGSYSTFMEIVSNDPVNSTIIVPVDLEVIPNLPPIIANPIADTQMFQSDDDLQINLSAVFSDPEDDFLSFECSSLDSNVATCEIADGNTLVLTPLSEGISIIRVTTTDVYNNSITDNFILSVIGNTPPQIIKEMADTTVNLRDVFLNIDLTKLFFDPDGDKLSYTVSNTNGSVASAILSGDKIYVQYLKEGLAILTIEASDNIAKQTAASTFGVLVKLISSTNEISSGHINIYPNPSSDDVYVDLSNISGKQIIMELYSASGELIKQLDAVADVNTINMSDLNQGIYILRIGADDQQFMKKIIHVK